METVDGEEWIVHPKVKQKEEPEADYCKGGFGGCKYDCLYDHSFFREKLQTCLRTIFLLRLILLCSVIKDQRSATGIVSILHLVQILEIMPVVLGCSGKWSLSVPRGT